MNVFSSSNIPVKQLPRLIAFKRKYRFNHTPFNNEMTG